MLRKNSIRDNVETAEPNPIFCYLLGIEGDIGNFGLVTTLIYGITFGGN